MQEKKTVLLQVHIEPEQKAWIDQQVKKLDLDVSKFIRRILRELKEKGEKNG